MLNHHAIFNIITDRISDENLKFKVEFSSADASSAMQKLCSFAAKFNCALDCVEFRDITSFLAPLEFKLIVEKLTNMRFTDQEVRGVGTGGDVLIVLLCCMCCCRGVAAVRLCC